MSVKEYYFIMVACSVLLNYIAIFITGTGTDYNANEFGSKYAVLITYIAHTIWSFMPLLGFAVFIDTCLSYQYVKKEQLQANAQKLFLTLPVFSLLGLFFL